MLGLFCQSVFRSQGLHYARSVKCQMHVKGNMSQSFPTLLFLYFCIFDISFFYSQALNVLDSSATPLSGFWFLDSGFGFLAPGPWSLGFSLKVWLGFRQPSLRGVVDCHFLRCGNLRLLIKKYIHQKHVEGIMRLFCCYFYPCPPLFNIIFTANDFSFYHSQWHFVLVLCGMNIVS